MLNLSAPRCNWRRFVAAVSFMFLIGFSSTALAGSAERQRAKTIHDRLAGVPPTNAVIDQMEQLLLENKAVDAAQIAIDNPAFYNVTIKNFAAPWTNEAQDVFVPLNDYTATVIGMVRDNVDFRQVLSGDIIYVGNVSGLPAYSNSNNNHYEALENGGHSLASTSNLVQRPQSSLTALDSAATAGVMTTRAAAAAFFSGGTNRLMFRATLMHHLCTDLEPLKDVTRVPDRVRRDVSRSPGGDSSVFLNSCVGCHAGMDGMAGAFAYYEFNEDTGAMQYRSGSEKFDANGVAVKYNINANNFPYGYVTTDDSWVNYWRNGQNTVLGWAAATEDENGHTQGSGAKSLGIELANSRAFSTCQVKKAFKAVCFRDPDNYAADRTQVGTIADDFETNGYRMQDVFARVAAYCTQ